MSYSISASNKCMQYYSSIYNPYCEEDESVCELEKIIETASHLISHKNEISKHLSDEELERLQYSAQSLEAKLHVFFPIQRERSQTETSLMEEAAQKVKQLSSLELPQSIKDKNHDRELHIQVLHLERATEEIEKITDRALYSLNSPGVVSLGKSGAEKISFSLELAQIHLVARFITEDMLERHLSRIRKIASSIYYNPTEVMKEKQTLQETRMALRLIDSRLKPSKVLLHRTVHSSIERALAVLLLLDSQSEC